MASRHEELPDYYGILGIGCTATPKEITAAYYHLARHHHPDVSADDRTAHREFKRVNEAYRVLSDPRRRRAYDRQRHGGRSVPARHTARPHRTVGEGGRFAEMEAATLATKRPVGVVPIDVPVAPEEAAYGGVCELTVTYSEPCPSCRGCQPARRRSCGSCAGTGTVDHHDRVVLRIPAGTRSGTIFQLPGRGGRLPGTSRRGNLYVRAVIRPCW